MWQNQWDMDPRGLTAEPDKDGKAALELKLINSLRERAIEPIIAFKENFGATAKHKSFALVKLFEQCKVNIKLNEMCANYSRINYTYYADASGKVIIPAEYEDISTYDNGYKLKSNGSIGLADANGKIIIPPCTCPDKTKLAPH